HHKIEVIHEGIDTDTLRPDPEASFTLPNGTTLHAGQPIVTYVARNLEPYRGFHSFMRCLPQLLQHSPDCQVLIVGGDDVSYGSKPKDVANWREKLQGKVSLDPARVHFLGRIPYDSYRKVLQISATHVYLTYPFVLSWSMLEAMASGCLVIGSATPPVREVIRHQENGLLVDFFDASALANAIAHTLQHPEQYQNLRHTACQQAHLLYSHKHGLAAYLRLIHQ
ncbi:MAG: glycosyltransferase, partial [Burkholderiales bacterium]